MEQFKSTMEDFVQQIRNDLADKKINMTREVLIGLFITYAQNLVDLTEDQKRYEDGLFQKNWTGLNVENTELLVKRCLETAAVSYLLYEEFSNE